MGCRQQCGTRRLDPHKENGLKSGPAEPKFSSPPAAGGDTPPDPPALAARVLQDVGPGRIFSDMSLIHVTVGTLPLNQPAARAKLDEHNVDVCHVY